MQRVQLYDYRCMHRSTRCHDAVSFGHILVAPCHGKLPPQSRHCTALFLPLLGRNGEGAILSASGACFIILSDVIKG
jgi:hypothetical protein